MKIYISGPITNCPDYERRFLIVEKWLRRRNPEDTIINPAYLGKHFPGYTHSEYMRMCMVLLHDCDAICLMEGWSVSEGAKEEVSYALDRGMAIMEAEV